MDSNESIKWVNGINVSAYIKKRFFKTFLFGLFPPFAILMLGIPYSWLLLLLSCLKVIPMRIGLYHFIFSVIIVLIYIYILYAEAKNTYFCITNKRIIKRNGAFNNNFIHYSLKNIGTISVDGSIFDKKGENASGTLVIAVKDFHTNTYGNTMPEILSVDSLNNVYEAYKMLSNVTEGNNENLRVKIEK